MLGRLRLNESKEGVHGRQTVVPGSRACATILLDVFEKGDDQWSINLLEAKPVKKEIS